MSETTHDLLIIGGGPAGLSAAIYATRAGLDSLTIEQGAFGGQITTTDEVDNYPGIEGVNGGELGTRLQEHAEHLGAAFAYDTIEDVTRNEDGTFTASGYDGTYTAKTLIYAAGATPRKAGFAGEDEFRGRGVSYCATCDGMFYTGKRIFVIGGGNSACEEAVFLSRFASEVTLIVRKEHQDPRSLRGWRRAEKALAPGHHGSSRRRRCRNKRGPLSRRARYLTEQSRQQGQHTHSSGMSLTHPSANSRQMP